MITVLVANPAHCVPTESEAVMSESFTKSITISRNIEDVFALWMDFERFPDFMENVRNVTRIDDNRTHWKVQGPMGREVEWDAETTLLDPDTRVAWKAAGDHFKVSGQVIFTMLDTELTQVTVTMLVAPQGIVRVLATQIFTNIQERVESDMNNFKRYVETTTPRLVQAARER